MRVLEQNLERCAFGSKERAPKHPTSESLGGVKEALREGGGGDGGGGGGGSDGERERQRERDREEWGVRGSKGKRKKGRERVQRRGRGRHLRAIIIIARHNSAGLSTSAGTDWAIGPRWLARRGRARGTLEWDYWLRRRNER